ncbi:hypothetical protein ACE01N_20455 [Saccharicrinis sp. FJH2]|uniref:hypothetical protein n=1 Tax=Saccharicrinis sp. FJH65 TaxID=3344659 RepID=UPI0035F36D31
MNSANDNKEIRNQLKSLDAKEVISLLIEIETDHKEVDEIKSFLSSKSMHSIRTALLEMNLEVDQSKIKKVQKEISKFDKDSIKQAFRDTILSDPSFSALYSEDSITRTLEYQSDMFPVEILHKLPQWIIDDLKNLRIIGRHGGGVIIDG